MGPATAVWSRVYSRDAAGMIVLYDAIQVEMMRAAKTP
jgi:hypothetical protein